MGKALPIIFWTAFLILAFTTSRRGSGIGLYHVKEIIESLNGTIKVNNKLSKGVEFLISFKSNK
jgi:signal transduction histidine kinase